MRSHLTPQALAEAVAEDGIELHAADVATFVADARRLRVCDILAAVAIDPEQPAVARERALGRLVATYCQLVETPTVAESRSAEWSDSELIAADDARVDVATSEVTVAA